MGQHSSSEKGTIASAIDDGGEAEDSSSTPQKGGKAPTTTATTSATSAFASKNSANTSIQITSIEKDNEEEYDFLVKVVLVGDYGVGKCEFVIYRVVDLGMMKYSNILFK